MHGLLVHTYTTGLMITLRADRKVSTSLTAYVTYLPDSKQKSTEATSLVTPSLVPPELSLIFHGIDSTK